MAEYPTTAFPVTGSEDFESTARTHLENIRLAAIEDKAALVAFLAAATGLANGVITMDHLATLIPLSMLAALIPEENLDIQNTPVDQYGLIWNATSGKMQWVDISGVVGADTYQVKLDTADAPAFLAEKLQYMGVI